MGKVNYQEFLKRFEQSGMTHKEFAHREGISSHMVGYYLKRARDERAASNGFSEIKVQQPVTRSIRITCPGGIVVDIPV